MVVRKPAVYLDQFIKGLTDRLTISVLLQPLPANMKQKLLAVMFSSVCTMGATVAHKIHSCMSF